MLPYLPTRRVGPAPPRIWFGGMRSHGGPCEREISTSPWTPWFRSHILPLRSSAFSASLRLMSHVSFNAEDRKALDVSPASCRLPMTLPIEQPVTPNSMSRILSRSHGPPQECICFLTSQHVGWGLPHQESGLAVCVPTEDRANEKSPRLRGLRGSVLTFFLCDPPRSLHLCV